jgi:hypothetical protein
MTLTTTQRVYCRMLAKWRDETDYRSRVLLEAEIFKYEDWRPEVRAIRDRYPDNETLLAILKMDQIPEDTTYDLWKPEWKYAPRPYYELRSNPYGYMTALWRQTWHCMGRDSDENGYVWAQVRLGYGIDAQNLKRWTWTTDHTMIADPIELSITFSCRDGSGGAMGKSVLDILGSRTDLSEEIAAIAERWHSNGFKSRCSCMPQTYDENPLQRCLHTELKCGQVWWHEPLPASVIATVKGWRRDCPDDFVGSDEATIIDGNRATRDEIYSQEG